MGSRRNQLLLDTNIVLASIRGGPLGDYIERHYAIRSTPFRPLISIVTVGELHALAMKHGWGIAKRTVLEKLQRELVVIDISHPDILNAYAEVHCVAEAHGRILSKNDLWIAASVKASGATLLTTDRDFDCLYPECIDRIWIDPAKGKALL